MQHELYKGVCSDVTAILATEVARDNSMPGALEYTQAQLTLGRLWDRHTWEKHKSQHRWIRFIRGWQRSTVLRAIQLPLLILLGWAVTVLVFNRVLWLLLDKFPILRLPQTPLSLQAASIGLILVFRTNQTNDRLREAQKEMGRLSAVEREVLQMLLVHVPSQHTKVVCLVARYLAIFGWILKAELWDSDMQRVGPLAKRVLPLDEFQWLSKRESQTVAIIFRLRALSGWLYNSGALDKEAFKFIEDDLAKLGDIRSTCSRLTTFPIPPSYHRHGSRSILLWIGALPFALEGKGHSAIENLFTIAITGFVILGLDAIAIESEQPFDVVPLHEFARGVSKDVISVLEGFEAMPSMAMGCAAIPESSLTTPAEEVGTGLRKRG